MNENKAQDIAQHPMFHCDRITAKEQLQVIQYLIAGEIGEAHGFLDGIMCRAISAGDLTVTEPKSIQN